jgi:hypothetical protein
LARLLGTRTITIQELLTDYPVRPRVDRGIEADTALVILERSLGDKRNHDSPLSE